jgi:hypothetical protein
MLQGKLTSIWTWREGRLPNMLILTFIQLLFWDADTRTRTWAELGPGADAGLRPVVAAAARRHTLPSAPPGRWRWTTPRS